MKIRDDAECDISLAMIDGTCRRGLSSTHTRLSTTIRVRPRRTERQSQAGTGQPCAWSFGRGRRGHVIGHSIWRKRLSDKCLGAPAARQTHVFHATLDDPSIPVHRSYARALIDACLWCRVAQLRFFVQSSPLPRRSLTEVIVCKAPRCEVAVVIAVAEDENLEGGSA